MPPIIVALLLVPLLAAGILILVHRSAQLTRLVPALVLSGITGAILTAFFAFSTLSVPIAPYELGRGAWLPVLGQVALALYVGFGIGILIAAAVGIPYVLLLQKSRRM
jgi:hypothetical protein